VVEPRLSILTMEIHTSFKIKIQQYILHFQTYPGVMFERELPTSGTY
jgi:hypothetical protein